MTKFILALLSSTVLLSSGLQAFDRCDVVGSYIATQGTTADDAVMDQLMLHADGTAWEWQSNALINPITTGIFSPSIGSWKIKGKKIYVTTIDFTASPDPTVLECCDVNLSNYDRYTQVFRFVDKDTLERIRFAVRSFSFDQDPLTDEGTFLSGSDTVVTYKRVRVVKSDVQD